MTAGVLEILGDAAIAHASSYHQRRYRQSVFQFSTVSGSACYLGSVRSALSRCTSVTARDSTGTLVARLTVRPFPPVAGHQTFISQQTGTINGVNLAETLLYTIDGTDVYELGATVFGTPLTARPSSLAAQMAKLIARVRAYQCALACAQ